MIAKKLLLSLFLFLLADAMVFHSPLYRRLIKPGSSSGIFWYVLKFEELRPLSHKKEILVIGDSRIGEGFSAKRADQDAPADFKFINAGMPSTSLRDWYYFLREADPLANRYAAIVLPFERYSDTVYPDDATGRLFLDLHLLVSTLKYSDTLEMANETRDPLTKIRVIFDLIVRGILYQNDVQDFLSNPRERIREVRLRNGAGWDQGYDYPGRKEANPHLVINTATLTLESPLVLEPGARKRLEDWIAPPKESEDLVRYRKHWLGKILERYQDSKTVVVGVRLPSNPLGTLLPKTDENTGILASFEHDGKLVLLDKTDFIALQKPNLFFDNLHLNSEGRILFSDALAKNFLQKVGHAL